MMGRSRQLFGGRGMRFATAVLATLGIVGSGLVYQSGVDVPGAWASVTSSGLVMNLDATNTSSYPGSGTTWTDLTGSGRNATLVGSGTTYDAATRSIKFTNSGNGVNYASLAGNFNDFSGGVTIDFEGNFGSNADSFERIIDLSPGFDPNVTDTILVGRRGTGNDIFIDVRKNNVSFGHGYVALTAADMSTTNRWTITLGTDQGGLKFYKNGVAQTVLSTGTAPSLWTNPTNATRSANWIGRSNWPDQGFEGSLRYLRLYNRALSPSEVTANVTNTVTFNANGGTGSMSTQTASAPTALTSNTFTRTDYTFAGWNTAANGTGQSFTNASTFYFTNDATLYAQWTPAVPSGGTPTITGKAQVGQTLTASPGTWTSVSTPTYAYQWQESVNGSTWTNISGATASTFTLTSNQAAEYVRVQVVATNTAGSSSTASSTATSLVLSANSAASTAGTNNPVTDLIAAVPNDANLYNVSIVSSNLVNGKLKWSSTPSSVTLIYGRDTSGANYFPSSSSGEAASNWATTGYPILNFKGTGANLRTALASLGYTSSSVQTDTLRIYVNGASSSDTHVSSYIPIWDNGQLTFHYYTFQTQSSRTSTATQTFLQSTATLDGVTSPNNWHLMTPRYWIEDNRGWAMAQVPGRTQSQIALGGYADAGSNMFYYPAGTDGWASRTNFYDSGTLTAQNGLYAAWYNTGWFDNGINALRELHYICANATACATNLAGNFGWDEYSNSGNPQTQYIAETWSTTPLATGTSNTAVQTVRTSTPAAAPTGLTATVNSKTSVTLNWTAPGSTGSDGITDYSVQYSTDNSTWTTWSKSPSTSTTATITGLTAGVAYWFRVAAVTTITGAYSASISSAMTDTGTTTTLGGYSIPTNLTGTIRVLLWTSNASGKLSLGSATNIDGGIRNTANYPDTNAYTPLNGYNPATLLSAGRMIGLVDSSPTEINAALATLRYTSATASTDTIKMWVSNGTEYIPIANGSNVEFHYYNYTSTATTWTGAYGSSGNGTLGAAGASRTIDGVTLPTGTSFLATARYRAEDHYLKSLGTYAGWLAASDSSSTPVNATEGSWRWMGPDVGGNAGTAFWSGNYSTGSSVGGEYQNWVANNGSLGEPNGSTGENCLGYNGGGVSWNTAPTAGYGWNDFDCSSSRGYFWEAYSTNAPYGSNTTNSAGTNYTSNVLTQTVSVTAPAAAPTGLTATSTTAGQIDLSWTAPGGVADISSYSVQYSSDGTTWTEARGAASTTTTHTLTGLTSGTYYQIRVAAIVPSGTGYFASTYFTPAGASRITALTSTAKTINTLQVDGAVLGSRYVRVVLRATQAGATLKLGGTTSNIGTQRGTANASSIAAAGQMIGLTGTVANVNAALQGLVYTGPSSSTTDTISMWVSVGSTSSTPQDFVPVVNSRGEVEFHYFGFTTASLSWQAAVNAAASDSTQINGVNAPGKFLATVDTLDQQVAAMQYYGGAGWLNGGDYTTVTSGTSDGAWYWLGPDTGVSQFYSGTQNSGTSGIVGGSFVAWGANASNVQGEPNSGVKQNCLATIASPNALTNSGYTAVANVGGYGWDDGTCTSTQSYFWEYISNEPVGTTSAGDNFTTMTAQAVLVSPSAEGPGAVTANPSGSGAIAVGWTAPTVNAATGITGYTLQYSTSSTFASYTSVNTTAPSAVVTGLTNGTTYYFRVYATGSGWTGAASATATATASATAKTLTVVASGGGVAGTAYANVGGVVVPIGTSASINESDLEAALATGNVILAADTVTISSEVNWSSNSKLTLGNSSGSTVAINADLTATGTTAGLVIAASEANYSIQTRTGANVVLSGASSTLTIGGGAYTLLRSQADINAVSSSNSAWWYAVANPITLSSSYTVSPWNFTFTGRMDGLGNTLNNLTINNSTSHNSTTGAGFINNLGGATIRNIGFTNVNISSSTSGISQRLGAIAGNGSSAGTNTIYQVWATGFITQSATSGWVEAGGLFGGATAGTLNITRAWSSVAISTKAGSVGSGGIIGTNVSTFGGGAGAGNTLTIDESYSTGNILRDLTTTTWYGNGGIIGVAYGASTTIRNAFSWGNINSTGTQAGTSTAGISGVGGGTVIIQNVYTQNASVGWASSTAGVLQANVSPGSSVTGLTTGLWTVANGSSLVNLPAPTKQLYVRVVAPTDGSYGTLSYEIVDSTGTVQTASALTGLGLTVSGTPAYTIDSTAVKGTYNVNYVSGFTLGGTNAAVYALNAWINTTSVTITKYNQTVTWAPSTSIAFAGGTATPSALATSSISATISYAVSSAGATGCSVNASTGVLSYTAAGTCSITATAAATGDYLAASTTVAFVIGAPTSSITVVASGGGTQGTDFTISGGRLYVGPGSAATVNASDIAAALSSGSLVLAAQTVTINTALSWSADTTLTLGISTGSTVAINDVISATGTSAGIVIAASNYALNVKAGAALRLPGSSSTLSIGGNAFSLIRSASDFASVAASGRWALAAPVSFSGSRTSAPVNLTFTGTLDGLGNTVNGLAFAGATSARNLALIDSVNGATIRNLGVMNFSASISSISSTAEYVIAAVAGTVKTGSATFSQLWSTGNAVATGSTSFQGFAVGGLVGLVNESASLNLTKSWSSLGMSSAGVTVTSLMLGGLVAGNVNAFGQGNNAGGGSITMSEVYATGAINGPTATWWGIGGLIGLVWAGSTTISITDAFSWSPITSTSITTWGGVVGNVGGSTPTLLRTYTTSSYCYYNTAPVTGCTTGVTAGASSGVTGANWSSVSGSSLTNLPAPIQPLYVKPTFSNVTGSINDLSYVIVDSAGATKTTTDLTGLNLSVSGTATYAPSSLPVSATPYSVTYDSGLALGGTKASLYSLSAWMTGVPVTISRNVTTLSWSPTLALTRLDTGTTLAAPTSNSTATPTYSIAAAGTTGCSITSARALTFTAAGTCQVKVDYAQNTTYTAASQTVSIVISNSAPLAPTALNVTGGVANQRLDVSWTAPNTSTTGGTVSTYTLEYSSDGTNWTTVTGVAGTSTTITGLTNGTAYTVRVRAINTESMIGAWVTSGSAVAPYWLPSNTSLPTVSGSAVGGLTLTAADGTWNANGGTITATKYQWQRFDGTSWTNISGATSSNYVVSAANDTGKTLRVVVSKTNGSNSSAYVDANSAATATVTSGLATAPQNVTTARGNTQVSVNWAAPATTNGGTISAYKVLYKTSAGSTWTTAVASLSASTTSYTITSLTNGTAYDVQVVAVTAAGDGTIATVNSTTPSTTATNTAVPAITGTAAVGVQLSASTGTWNDGGAALTYSYQWQSASTSTGTYADISGATNSTYTPVTADSGRYLQVVLTATNAAGSVSATSSATAQVQTGLASAPQSFTASRGSTQLTLAWTAPSTANGGTISAYKVLYKKSTDSSWTAVSPNLASSATGTTLTGLTNGTTYDIQVLAVTAAGDGAAASTSAKPSTTGSNTLLPLISGTIAVGVQANVDNGTWTDGGDTLTYSYQWQIASAAAGTYANISGATSSTYTPVTADSGKYLKVVVTATNAAGATTATTEASSKIQTGLAGAPTLGVLTRGDQQIVVNWTAPSALNGGVITGYTVQTSTNGTSWTTASSSVAANATTYTVTGLTNGTAYTVRVFAVTAAGDGATATSGSSIIPAKAPSNSVVPTVSGTPAVSRALSSTDGTWAANGDSYTLSYQWQSAATANGTYTDISGATSASYTPVTADRGRFLRLKVTATNAMGSTSAVSIATAAVDTGLADAPTALSATFNASPSMRIAVGWTAPAGLNGATAITGYVVEYRIATTGTWTVASSSVAANATSYDLTGLTSGTSYDIRVAAKTAAGTGATVTTSSAVLFGGAPSNTAAPTVSGSLGVGETLTVTDGSWNDYGVTITGISYQWQRSSDGLTGWTDISGETYNSYTLTTADSGKYVRAVVEATNVVGSTGTSVTAGQIGTGIPTAPQSFAATDGNGQITLSWSAPASANGGIIRGYIVELNSGSGWSQVGTTLGSGATGKTITGLTNAQSYDVRVRAITTLDGVNATLTGQIPFTTPSNTGLPTLSGPVAVGETLTTTDGTWSANGRALTSISYAWQVSSNNGANWTSISGATNPSYDIPSGATGNLYRVVVSRTNEAGTTTATSVATSATESGVADAPTSVTVTRGDQQLTLNWTAPSQLNGGILRDYQVQYRVAGAPSWTTASRTASTTTSQIITGLSNGTSYEFQVTSVTGITGLTSSTVSGIPAGAPIVNSAATIAAGTRAVGYTITGTAGSFGINDAGTLSYSHRWEVSSTGTSGWTPIAGATASTFTPTSAEAGKYLRYVHIATNTRFSTESTTSATTVVGSGIPAAPATVTATVGAATGQINVSWAAVTGADLNGAVRGAYRIQVSTDGTTWSTPELSATANDTSYNVTGLTNGTPYMVRVAAASSLDVVGSPTQATGTFIPYAAPINTTVPTVSGAEARGYVLTSSAGIWNPNGRSVSRISYQWQVSADSGSSWTDISGATSSTYTLTANESGKLVRNRVTATNLAGSTSIETAPTGVIGTASAAAPTNLNVSPGDQQLSVSWTAPTQLDGGTIVDYEVSISTDQNTWTTVTRTPSTTTAQAITGLTNATNYWVRVAAVTTVTGAPVTSASATIPFGLPINTAVPTVSGSVRIGDTLTAAAGTWNGNGRTITETAYQWQTSTDGGLSWTDVSGATSASYVPSGVLGKLLRVRVTNTNLAGATSEVSAATVAVGIGTPGAPTGITLTPGDLSVTVNWTAPTWLADGSIQDYTVELNDGNGWIAVSRTASTVTSQTITGLALGTSYQVRVRTETGLSSAWLTSGNYVAIGKPAITTAPVVSGTTLAGETLTTTTGTWDINGSPLTSTTIRWQQSLDNGSNWTDIGGATSTTYIAAAGRIYRASITATNAAGSTTTNTAPTAYIVSVRPSAVRNLSIVPGDHSLAVTWTIPESLGGGTISDYLVEYSLNGDDWTAVSRTPSATPSQVITGLTNGSDYYVRVQAATTVTGFYALSSGQFRPYGAPISFGSLALISGTVRYAQTLTASTGSWDFNGSLSSAYAYQWQVSTDSGANWSNIAGATSSSLTLSGYVGNLIRVQVTATNVAGQATTATSNPTIAVDAANPTVPRDFSITPGDHQIALSWTVPSSLGGSALVGFTVQISETGNTWTTISRASALATTETITGLTNAVQYYVRVRAETLKSGGWANSPSTVVPYGRPINTVTPTLSGTAQYDSVLTADSGSWNENGSSASVSYQWQADTGSGWVNIPGATNAQYTVGNYVGAVVRSVVTATNAAGSTSAAASASTTIIAAPAGAVTGLTVTPADQSLQLAWTAPNYLGGAPIVDYRIEYSTDGSSWQSSPRSASATPSHTITGLVNGTAYQVRVRALNGVTGIAAIDASGTIPRGLPQNTVAPVVTMHPNSPTAPQIGRAISADTGTWLANGADISAVTYQWQVGSGSSWTSIAGATLASYTPTGNVGSQLRVTVTATNAAGDTTATSLTTTAILPAAASAPRNVTVIEDDHAFTLNWQAPSSTGGAPVTDYEVQISLDGDTWTPVTRSASTETTQTVSGLDNAVSYYARIRALNGVTGSWSFVTDIVPRGVPANLVAPTTSGTYEFRSVLTANDGDWDENGALITATKYQWQVSRDGLAWSDIPAATQQDLTVGLVVGLMLRVKVTKTNEAGSTTELSAATPVITAIPAATPVITSQQIGNTQVTLGWTPPIHSGGVTLVGYTLQYSTDQVNWTTINLGATTTSTTLTGLTNGTGYFARVRAETDRPGEWSPVAGPFTPVAPPVVVRLTAPISPTPSPLTSVLLTSVMPVAPVVTSMSSLTGPAEVTVTSDGRIELQPTQSIALKNGQPVQASVTLTETGMVVQTDTVNLSLAFDAVSDATTAANLQQGANAAVTGEGFAPSTPVVTWIQSTPTKLGTTTSSVTGSVNGSFTIPHTIAPGPHTIQINSVDVEGNVVSIIYGVEVKAAETTMQAMGTNLDDPHALSEAWLWWAIFGALVMLMLLAIIALRRRARS